MNITKNVINDLFPLYAANECSPDTRAPVDEYLKSNPQQAQGTAARHEHPGVGNTSARSESR